MIYRDYNATTKYTMTIVYEFEYSLSYAIDSSMGRAIGYKEKDGVVYWVRFKRREYTDNYSGLANPVTSADRLPFDRAVCSVRMSSGSLNAQGTKRVVWTSGQQGTSSYKITADFGTNKLVTLNDATYDYFLSNVPTHLTSSSRASDNPGWTTISRNSTITLNIEYLVQNPGLDFASDPYFNITFPLTSGGAIDRSSRQIVCSFNRPTAVDGTRVAQDARLSYTLQEEDPYTLTKNPLWSKYDDELGENVDYSFTLQPNQYNHTNNYILYMSYDRTGYTQRRDTVEIPGPTLATAPQQEMRYIGEDFESTPAQEVYRLISIMHGDALTLWWTNPVIWYAHGLKINFEILVAKNDSPQTITANNIIDIVTGDTNGKEYRTFPGSGEYVPEIYRSTPSFNTFFFRADGANESLPTISGVIPMNNGSSQDMPFLYSYTITTEVLEKYANNYDKLFFAVCPIITQIDNSQGWKTGSNLNPTTEVLRELNWQPFLYIKETHMYYCSDEYWDSQRRKIYIGDLQWRNCQLYYCPDGVTWRLVTAQYAPGTNISKFDKLKYGDSYTNRWVFC